jgi:hypothetical protein
MKKLTIFLMLSGVLTLEAKPKYRIETWVLGEHKQYLPQRRVWAKTNYFTLPYKVWESGSYPFQHKEQAEQIIKNWKDDVEAKKLYNKSEFYYYN